MMMMMVVVFYPFLATFPLPASSVQPANSRVMAMVELQLDCAQGLPSG